MTAFGADALATQLRERIREGTLSPGSTLNQVSLAEEFGVSRIPLREALRSLHGEGLVVLEAGQAARVVEHTEADITDLYDLRLRLEPILADEIIDTLASTDLRELGELAQQMARHPEPGDWSNLNRRFHQIMYARIDRHYTLRLLRQLIALVEPYSNRYVHDLFGLDRASAEHLAMLDAIHRRDPDRLESLIHAHLAAARDALLAALNSKNQQASESR